MAGVALRRLMTEYKRLFCVLFYVMTFVKFFLLELTVNPPEGILAGPIDENNFFEWDCLITGPDGTCFENGVFLAKLLFSEVRSFFKFFNMFYTFIACRIIH